MYEYINSQAEDDILVFDTSFLCVPTNLSKNEGSSSQNTDDNTSISFGEMEPEILLGTDSTLISPSIPIQNQIPALPTMINVNNVSIPEDLEGSLPNSNV